MKTALASLAAGEAFNYLVQHSDAPLKRASADTLIMAMYAPAFFRPGIEAGNEAVDLGAELRDVLGIGPACQ